MKVIFYTILFALLTSTVEAQEVKSLIAGTRVRVSATTFVTFKAFKQGRPADFDGTVVRMDSDTLVVKAKGWGVPVSFPLAAITHLQIVRGKKSAFKSGMLLGAWVGSIVGAELFLNNDSASAKRTAALEVVSVGVTSGLAGALFGSLIKISRWESIPTSRFGSADPPQGEGRLAYVSTSACPFESNSGR